jgi:hypothetical protein
LRIYPCSPDIELVVLSFILAEKKRRARVKSKAGEGKALYAKDEPSEGGMEGNEAEASTGTYGEM